MWMFYFWKKKENIFFFRNIRMKNCQTSMSTCMFNFTFQTNENKGKLKNKIEKSKENRVWSVERGGRDYQFILIETCKQSLAYLWKYTLFVYRWTFGVTSALCLFICPRTHRRSRSMISSYALCCAGRIIKVNAMQFRWCADTLNISIANKHHSVIYLRFINI